MIFVTVGTHEEPFNRLIEEIDRLAGSGTIGGDIFIQRGYGSVMPRNCRSSEILPYAGMLKMMKEADIVITHGGTGSVMTSLANGKPPIVVPRMAKYGEHVDDHQVDFAKRLEAQKKILAVYEIETLTEKIVDYEIICRKINSTRTASNTLVLLIENLERYCRSLGKEMP